MKHPIPTVITKWFGRAALTGTFMMGAFMAAALAAHAGGPFIVTGSAPMTVSEAGTAAAIRAATPGKFSAGRKSLTFVQKTIRLVAVTGPEKDMLTYRIDGLRNPALGVPAGALLRVLFVNADGDMFHNLRFGTWQASYPNVADALVKASAGSPQLPHGTAAAHHAVELTLRVPSVPGKYAYFCTVRGHAQGGMWGTVLVR